MSSLMRNRNKGPIRREAERLNGLSEDNTPVPSIHGLNKDQTIIKY